MAPSFESMASISRLVIRYDFPLGILQDVRASA